MARASSMAELAEKRLRDQLHGTLFIETVIAQVQHRLMELNKLHQVLLSNVLHINHPSFHCRCFSFSYRSADNKGYPHTLQTQRPTVLRLRNENMYCPSATLR